MPLPLSQAAAAASVFVSSTCKDMETYRRAVEDALRNKAQVACFLSEEWLGGYDDTVQKCKDRVLGSFGFFLLISYYYGWSPSGGKSITHLEFEWALDRWKSLTYPPMAVFAPRQNSDAETELKLAAQPFIPADPQEREQHDRLLEQFRSQVLNSGRTAQFYSHRYELRENAIVACLQWKGETPSEAARKSSGAAPARTLTDAELGSLGRKAQLNSLEDILALFYAEPAEPALLLLVNGNEYAGQRVFLCHVAQSGHLSGFRPVAPGHPPTDQYDIPVLTQWVASVLGLTAASHVQDPRALADSVAEELRRQPLCFMLDGVEALKGSLAAFVRDFWQPLRSRLVEIDQERPLPNRLLAWIAGYREDTGGAASFVSPSEIADYSRALALPRLEDFKPKDVLLWLNELKVPDQPPGKRGQIAASVVNNASGLAEGSPLRVYEQLRSIQLFP